MSRPSFGLLDSLDTQFPQPRRGLVILRDGQCLADFRVVITAGPARGGHYVLSPDIVVDDGPRCGRPHLRHRPALEIEADEQPCHLLQRRRQELRQPEMRPVASDSGASNPAYDCRQNEWLKNDPGCRRAHRDAQH